MTIRERPPVTQEMLAAANRVWDLAGRMDREAIVLHAYEYPCEFVSRLPWRDIGSRNQEAIARSMAQLTEVLARGTLAPAQTGKVNGQFSTERTGNRSDGGTAAQADAIECGDVCNGQGARQ